ncbi:MAG: glycosyltransferase family 2 protein [Dehalococcoidia bacterium]
MLSGKRISVVVPCHNEQLLIGRVIATMPDFVDRIIVVDDVSTDETAARVEEHVRQQPGRVELIRHQVNQGVGGAIVTGYQRALDAGDDVIAVMGGDAQMDPGELIRVVGPVVDDQCDYTKGNRFFWSETFRVMPRHRFLGNVALSLMSKAATGYWHVADYQSGYTAISALVLRELLQWELYPRYGFPNDVLVKLNVLNARVADIPIRSIYRVGEKSGIKIWRVSPKISLLLWKGFWWRLWEKYVMRFFHPLVFFYTLGMVMLPAGLALGLALVVARIAGEGVATTSAVFAALLVTTGLQLLLFGMSADQAQGERLQPDSAAWRTIMSAAREDHKRDVPPVA